MMDANQFQQFLQTIQNTMNPAQENPIEKIKRNALNAVGPKLGPNTNFANWKILFQIFRSKHQLDKVIDGNAVDAEFQAQILLSHIEESVIPKIRLCMENSEIYNTTILNGAEADQNKRFQNYMCQIEALFSPPSESRLSKVDFKARIQSVNEDVSSYFSSKCSLWEAAYGVNARDTHFDTLLDETIRGLYNLTIKREIRGRAINTVEALREQLVDAVAVERLRIEDGSSEATSLDGLAATTRSMVTTHEMMDTSNHISRMANREDKCKRCGKYGHFARDCWTKMPNPRNQQHDKNKQDTGRYRKNNNTQNYTCDYCHIKGHIKKDCRKRMRNEGQAHKYEKGNKADNGRGYNKQQRYDKRGVRSMQDSHIESQNDNEEGQNDQQSFLDNGEELQERH